MSKVWIATKGQFEVECASTLKGLSELINVSYATMKSKGAKAEMFTVVAEGMEVWFVIRKRVKKVMGRGRDGIGK